jgi:hypothetical protein
MSWRHGRKIHLNVYDGDRPVCQCHTVEDAAQIILSVNAADAIAQIWQTMRLSYPPGFPQNLLQALEAAPGTGRKCERTGLKFRERTLCNVAGLFRNLQPLSAGFTPNFPQTTTCSGVALRKTARRMSPLLSTLLSRNFRPWRSHTAWNRLCQRSRPAIDEIRL